MVHKKYYGYASLKKETQVCFTVVTKENENAADRLRAQGFRVIQYDPASSSFLCHVSQSAYETMFSTSLKKENEKYTCRPPAKIPQSLVDLVERVSLDIEKWRSDVSRRK